MLKIFYLKKSKGLLVERTKKCKKYKINNYQKGKKTKNEKRVYYFIKNKM